jgi:hypothetical protein
VNVAIYADESGTHDRAGIKKGSSQPVICGIAAKPKDWAIFTSEWTDVLNEYDVEYFHFYEWSQAALVARKKRQPNSEFTKNPYKHMSHATLDRFLFKLAKVAGSGRKVMITGGIHIPNFQRIQNDGAIPRDHDPYDYAIYDFLENTKKDILDFNPAWSGAPISFIFDLPANKAWRNSILSGFASAKEVHPEFVECNFSDKLQNIPLQAADMLAYRMRQLRENSLIGPLRFWRELDHLLLAPRIKWCAKNDTLKIFYRDNAKW